MHQCPAAQHRQRVLVCTAACSQVTRVCSWQTALSKTRYRHYGQPHNLTLRVLTRIKALDVQAHAQVVCIVLSGTTGGRWMTSVGSSWGDGPLSAAAGAGELARFEQRTTRSLRLLPLSLRRGSPAHAVAVASLSSSPCTVAWCSIRTSYSSHKIKLVQESAAAA